ncbi:two-component sensor histidine kinase [Pararhizobium capsulatum DSM 1112]|uniref:histidine kinase n=1 Tax=Pararhizobium capsulatum DSM 1112 TaxID=1121113 RepID=A0ABU0BSZ6_9HYPH|nr:sensor histidine kinase [Pararhizobium capsulatum]MDQ0321375.1 two-component sensor histidine kinase [Pararhizobium capsulatum DSM 1112]
MAVTAPASKSDAYDEGRPEVAIDGKTRPPDASDLIRAHLTKLVLEKTGVGYLFQSPDLELLHVGPLPQGLSTSGGNDPDAEMFGEEHGKRLIEAKRLALNGSGGQSLELDITNPSGQRIYRIDIERIESHQGGVLSVITDISESHRRERVLRTLLRELSHRSKNLLAIIQGVATQTARQALSLDCFLVTFRGRIQSLASSQDLVTDSSWRGVFLFTLVEKQLQGYWPDPEMPAAITGIDAYLSPNAALHIGLALHELVVNSASHGALAVGVTSLTINCFETIHEGGKAVEINWIEHLPPSIVTEEVDERPFGRTVLERVVPSAVDGKAYYLTSPDQIEYRLIVPAREYEIITRLEE